MLQVTPCDSISVIKMQLSDRTGVDVADFVLVCQGKFLRDDVEYGSGCFDLGVVMVPSQGITLDAQGYVDVEFWEQCSDNVAGETPPAALDHPYPIDTEADDIDIIEDVIQSAQQQAKHTVDDALVAQIRQEGADKVFGGRSNNKDKTFLELSGAAPGSIGYAKRSNPEFAQWLEKFENAKTGKPLDAPSSGRCYSFVNEPINMQSIDFWLSLVGTRNLVLENGLHLSDVLISIKQRARKVDGKWCVTVAKWDCTTLCDLKGRSFTGFHPDDTLPAELAHEEGIPAHLRGLSPFAFPKLVKYICRAGLGVSELDLVNAFFQVMRMLFPNFDFTFVHRYLNSRPKYLDLGTDTYGVSADVIKELFLRVGFLGSYAAWLKENSLQHVPGEFSDFVDGLSLEMVRLALHIKAVRPDLFDAAVALKGECTSPFKHRQALACMMVALYMDKERDLCNRGMQTTQQAFSNEFDGFATVSGNPRDDASRLGGATGFKWSVKAYPENLLAFAMAKYPDQLWKKSELAISVHDYIDSRQQALESLKSGRAYQHTMSFGKVLACCMEGRIIVPKYNGKVVEVFDVVNRGWTCQQRVGDGTDDFTFMVKNGELGVFANFSSKTFIRQGKVSYHRLPLAEPLDAVSFISVIAKEALQWLKLAVRPLDDPLFVRGKLLFGCGTVYDYKTGSTRRGEPEDRICKRIPHDFKLPEWLGDPDVQELLDPESGLTASIVKFWKAGGKSLVQAKLGGDAGVHMQLAARIEGFFDTLRSKDRMLGALCNWTDDLDEVIYHGMNFARGAARDERPTECIWLAGAAETGKDFYLNLISGFADGPQGMLANLPYGYLTNISGSRKEGASAFLSACEAAGFIVVSEVPNEPITLATLKPLCEQRGAKIAVRDGYQFGLSQGGSAGFRPMGLTVITSNFGPNVLVKEQADSGGQTRVNMVTSKFIWSRNPVGVNQKTADANLNQDALAGKFADSFLWLTTAMHPLLDHSTFNRKIGPIPPRIQMLTQAAFKQSEACPETTFREWLGGLTGVESATEASSADELRRSAIAAGVPHVYFDALCTTSDLVLVQLLAGFCLKRGDRFLRI